MILVYIVIIILSVITFRIIYNINSQIQNIKPSVNITIIDVDTNIIIHKHLKKDFIPRFDDLIFYQDVYYKVVNRIVDYKENMIRIHVVKHITLNV